jgi:hypothetical protein
MHLASGRRNINCGQRDVGLSIEVDQAVALEPCQKLPAMGPHGLQVLQTAGSNCRNTQSVAQTGGPWRSPAWRENARSWSGRRAALCSTAYCTTIRV